MTTLDPSHNPFSSKAQAVHRPDREISSQFPDTLPTAHDSESRPRRRHRHGRRSREQEREEARERVKASMPPMPDLRFEQVCLLFSLCTLKRAVRFKPS